MLRLLRRALPVLRVLVCIANVPVMAFGYYNLDGFRHLSPRQDFARAPEGTIRHYGDYIYLAAFAPAAIRMLLFALLVTTILMVFRFETGAAVDAER